MTHTFIFSTNGPDLQDLDYNYPIYDVSDFVNLNCNIPDFEFIGFNNPKCSSKNLNYKKNDDKRSF